MLNFVSLMITIAKTEQPCCSQTATQGRGKPQGGLECWSRKSSSSWARQQRVVSMLTGITGGRLHNPLAVSHKVMSCTVSCFFGAADTSHPSPAQHPRIHTAGRAEKVYSVITAMAMGPSSKATPGLSFSTNSCRGC